MFGRHGHANSVRPNSQLVELDVSRLPQKTTAASCHGLPFQPTERFPQGLLVGLDVGSTTIKAVVVDPTTEKILWKDYQRHDTRQAEKCLEFLESIAAAFPEQPANGFRIFATGSGGASLSRHICARYVQEVNAVSLAVEKLHPDVGSVIELGGQDAKIIVFKEDPQTGQKKKVPSMNDKCAGGTGAVIDKINAKLQIAPEDLCRLGYHGLKLHPVAGKCGVFAETDINGLQKQGVPAEELMASLFESLIQQNLSVLTRGHTLRPKVLLLGGPNTFIRGMVECWRHNLALVWQERHVQLPPGVSVEELIIVPENAQYFAAIGAVEFARTEVQDHPHLGVYQGPDQLRWYLEVGRIEEKKERGSTGLWRTPGELEEFLGRYRQEPWQPARFAPGTTVQAFLGLDGGSTSTKGVLLDPDKKVIARAYQLSRGNPIEDMMDIFAQLHQQILDQDCTLEVLGVGTTGYAKDILKDVIRADVALVETVAHTQAGLHFYPDIDVIVDVGGQDIKLIILKNGQVKDFKLNTQCSAGNGYFLQSTAVGFGYPVEDYARMAFAAQAMPEFGYGCAVFLQSDIVDFQRQGWTASEILAGLAAVLPKNIWLYVSQIPNLAKLGRRFLLQGGTQHNLAAVKAQVDFINSRFAGTGIQPEVFVHKFCGEAGAIGCAVEAHRLVAEQGRRTTFIGLDKVARIGFRATRSEDTRCYFCKNQCLRTFVDVEIKGQEVGSKGLGAEVRAGTKPSRQPAILDPQPAMEPLTLRPGERRLIIATCEKGTVEEVDQMRAIKKGLEAVKAANPNLVAIAGQEVFRQLATANVADPWPRLTPWNVLSHDRLRQRRECMRRRPHLRIGIVRALNIFSTAPFFLAYFQSLGLHPHNLVFSDFTTEQLYREGAKRGAIDPCFPSKVCIPHVHNLLFRKHRPDMPLHYIFFPMIDSLPSFLEGALDTRACPTVSATPEATKAAFIKETNLFKEHGIAYKHTFVQLNDATATARQMFEDWQGELGLSQEENQRAVQEGFRALRAYNQRMRQLARQVLDTLERDQRLGIVLLGRPYHSDPGLNHEITDELQKLGYPIFTQDFLPLDDDVLQRLFGAEVTEGDISSPLSIDDVWKNSFSENTNRKIWAAKFAARHPNLVALELSSFKCGMDSPVYSIIEEIVESSATPYFCFKDIDENRPAGSIKIRIETIAYFLKRYQEQMAVRLSKLAEIDGQLAELEQKLRRQFAGFEVGQIMAQGV